MKIGLYNLEPHIENTALMQVSKYYKDKGDTVELYEPIFHNTYDKVYAFCIFNFTPKHFVRKDMICGGTGFDFTTKLPKEIENCNLDYSIYPNCKVSYLWFSRGCIRKCPFCVVPKKEGHIYSVEPKNLNPNGEKIMIMDNNFFANKEWKDAIKHLLIFDQPIEFNSGIDVRIFNDEQGEALQKLKHSGYFHIAWDNPKDNIQKKIKHLIKYIKPYKILCYVLIGYWSTPEEDMYRIKELKKLKVDPFIMPFNKKDSYQKTFARWCNHKAIFKTVAWQDYKKTKKKYPMKIFKY